MLARLKSLLTRYLSYQALDRMRSILCALLYYTGVGWVASRAGRHRGGAVLVYHSIGGKNVFSDSVVNTARFREQIEFLANRYTVVPLCRMIQQVENGSDIPDDWVSITFDDGYRDVFINALPVLRDKEIPHSVYIPSGFLDDKAELFADSVQRALNACKETRITLNLNGRRVEYQLNTQAQRDDAALRIVLSIRDQAPEQRDALTQSVLAAVGMPPPGEQIYLSSSELERLGRFAETGSHSVTHANLASLSADALSDELTQSKRDLESITRQPVTGLAYPFGKPWSYSPEVQACARENGYVYALTTRWGKVNRETDLFSIPRIGVGNSTIRMKLNLLGVNI